ESVASGESEVILSLSDGTSRSFDWLLVATGRRPVTGPLNLAAAGIEVTHEGFIAVNDRLETSAPGTYAIGDCIPGLMTATQALHDAGIAVANIIGGGAPSKRAPDQVPEVIYSALEMARIGLDDDRADDAGLEAAVGFSAYGTSPEALAQDDAAGFVRILADAENGRFLGGEIVGREAGELIQVLALLANGGTLSAVTGASFNHPARAEEILNAIETMAARWNLADMVFRR
ncbi:MAG: FAD-dependent oxidoreductase, partial [Acidiferrobacteraceae bacterium]